MASEIAGEAALERSKELAEPLDPAKGQRMLKELKQIFDQAGVTFFMRHGTCLGAIRNNAFIPWDDDLDVGCVIGLHGFTEESIDPIIATFRDNGFFAKVEYLDHSVFVSLLKSAVRTEWACYRIIDGGVFQYPGIRIPVRLFTDLKEIEFMGVKLHVPNPPEEYLRVKYGEDWRTPKQVGYEKDVVEMIQIVSSAKSSGVIFIGGGTPKNFIQQAALYGYLFGKETRGHEYAIQITTDSPHWGGLSGCTRRPYQVWAVMISWMPTCLSRSRICGFVSQCPAHQPFCQTQ